MNDSNYINEYFSSLKVLDISSVLAGPQVGSFFAELGATVIKIENKRTGGDPTRQWKLEIEKDSDSISSYYASANYNKESIFLDLQLEEDYASLVQLVQSSDIVISNFQPRVGSKLKVDYPSLVQYNDRLIYAQLHAYAADDPRPGYDLVMQAETGFMYMNGYPDGAPAKMPVAVIDLIAAHQMKEAILIALLKRERKNKGSYIEVSLYQSAISLLANQASNYLMTGHIPQRMGSLHPNIAPYGDVFTSKDHVEFLLAVGSDDQFHKLAEILKSDMLLTPVFENNNSRLRYRSQMNTILQKEFDKYTFDEIDDFLSTSNIPNCRVLSIDQVFDDNHAKNMVLNHKIEGKTVKSVSQISFKIN